MSATPKQQSLTSNNNNDAPDRTPAYCVTSTAEGNHKAPPSLHRGIHHNNNTSTNGLNSSRSLDSDSSDSSSNDSGNGAVPTDGTRFSKFINSIKYALGSRGSQQQQLGTAAMLLGDHESNGGGSSSSSSRTSSTRPLVIKSTSVIKRTATTHSSSSSSTSELTTDCTKRGGRHKASDGTPQTANGMRNNRRRT